MRSVNDYKKNLTMVAMWLLHALGERVQKKLTMVAKGGFEPPTKGL
jgi:hypothetical protein